MLNKKILLYIALLVPSILLKAQENIFKNPKKAAVFSAAIPGLGQIYTEKYWKVPIIYAGLITTGYYIKENYSLYNKYKTTYVNRLQGDITDEYINLYSNNQLVTLTEYYKRNTEVSVLFFALTYILNILDASVSAHLFEYNISEELSIDVRPVYLHTGNSSGLSLSIKL